VARSNNSSSDGSRNGCAERRAREGEQRRMSGKSATTRTRTGGRMGSSAKRKMKKRKAIN